MFFGLSRKWKTSVEKLQKGELSAQEFVNLNERQKIYYSTPFIEDEKGQRPNVLRSEGSEVAYFPAFTSAAGLQEHMRMICCAEYIAVKGNLKNLLYSLDAHPMLKKWGVVIDPYTDIPAELPPETRVQPKCLR